MTWVKEYCLENLKENDIILDVVFLMLHTEIDDQTKTYSIQIKFETKVHYTQFQIENESMILAQIQKQFEGKIFTFVTLLEEI